MAPHENNGVFWYLTEKTSFGFSPNAEVQQMSADLFHAPRRGAEEEATADDRLSWHINDISGGYRAGRVIDDVNGWRKLIYYI